MEVGIFFEEIPQVKIASHIEEINERIQHACNL